MTHGDVKLDEDGDALNHLNRFEKKMKMYEAFVGSIYWNIMDAFQYAFSNIDLFSGFFIQIKCDIKMGILDLMGIKDLRFDWIQCLLNFIIARKW